MPEIQGKAVVFTDSLPARVWWELYPKLAAIKQGERLLDKLGWDGAVALCRAIVTGWECAGDPQDSAAYDNLDFLVMMELVTKCYDRAIELLNRTGAGKLGE